MIQKQRNIIFALNSYKKFKHVILLLWIIYIILLLNGNEKVSANNFLYENFQSDFNAKKNYEKSPLSINYFPFTTQHTQLTISHSLLSINQTKLSTYNLALSTKQDSCPTGHEADVWVLGNKGLNWKKGNPSKDTGFNVIAPLGESYTSYSDENGDLLIIATNNEVYNKYYEVIDNQKILPFGGSSSFMNLLVPAPNSDSLFYFFYPNQVLSGTDTFPHPLYYAVIDIKANNGRGKYLKIHIKILENSAERVEGIRHCNGKDWWIIGQNSLTDSFYVWLLNENGLIEPPQMFDSGNKNKEGNYVVIGHLKSSHSGAFIVEGTYGKIIKYPGGFISNSSLEIHHFDPLNGRIYGSIDLPVKQISDRANFGHIEFSSDDRMLYAGFTAYQMDISSLNPQKIVESSFPLNNYWGTGAALGKNLELYFTNPYSISNNPESNYLGHVKYPRRWGWDMGHNDLYLDLGKDTRMWYWAPHFAQSIRFPYKAYIQTAYLRCKDSLLEVHILDPCPHEKAEWSLLDGGEIVSTSSDGDTVYLKYKQEGEYHIAVRYPARCGFKTDTVDIKIMQCQCNTTLFQFPISDTSLCAASDYILPFHSSYDYVSMNKIYFHQKDTIKLMNLKKDTILNFRFFNFYGCDTFVSHHIHIYNPNPPTFDTIHLCYGDSAWIDGRYYSAVSTVKLKYKVSGGCDSVHTTFLNYSEEPTITFQNFRICAGDSVEVNGKFYTQDTFFTYKYLNVDGCDSFIFKPRVIVYPAILPSQSTIIICKDDSIRIKQQWYKIGDRFSDTLQNNNGCDSIIQYNILPSKTDTTSVRHLLCAGDSILLLGRKWGDPQTLFEVLQSSRGCKDSLIMHDIRLLPAITPTMREYYLCKGDSIFINNQWIKSAQSIETKLKSFAGCDSIIMYEIKLLPSIAPTMREHYICNGDSIFINNQWIKSAQRIETKLKSFTGCDSIIIHEIKLHTTIAPTMREHYICNGDSIFINSQWIKSAQNIETKLRSFTGCDSILQDNIIMKPLLTREIQFYICYGDSVQVFGSWYDEEIQFDRRISSSNPALCDSLIEYQIIQYEDIYVDLPQRIEIEEGSPVNLTSTFSPNAKTFHWSPSQDLSCTDCPNPICTSPNDRIYYLEVSDEYGCISSDSMLVLVKKKSGEFFFPNAFSPNADGINDLWIPVASSAQLNLISLHIYSRWGEQVYSCTSSCKGWDGKMNEQVVNPGVYVYHMVFRDERGDRKEVNGEFTLLR